MDKDKFFSLDLILVTLINKETITKENIYNLIFNDGFETLFDGVDDTIISKNIEKISMCFDLNGDGHLDERDLEYLKNLDIVSILKIVNAVTYFIEIVKSLTQIKLNTKQKIDLIYRIIVYSAILPLTKNLEKLRTWLKRSNNKELLIAGLELIYNSLQSSDKVKSVVNKISLPNLFPCCFKKSNIVNLEEKINSNITNIHSEYKINKKLEIIEDKINNMNNKTMQITDI